jgi:uncharacterized protein (DUF1330 family)
MICYFIAHINIHDAEEYQKYLNGFDQVFKNYDGEVIFVDEDPTILEGEWSYSRMVMIRFSSEEEAKRWYFSPEYQEIVKHRHKSSSALTILAHGRE